MTALAVLNRATFRTSRLLDFASEKELVAQTGHRREQWPLVILKELVDNALDACEEAGIAPAIDVVVNETGITVSDNGPGLPTKVVSDILDFSVKVSSREAYVSPTRGAQGNALKTIVAMPYVLDGERGRIEIEAKGVRHLIEMGVDRIRQEPVIDHQAEPSDRNTGTLVRVCWPDSAFAQLCQMRVIDSYKLPRTTRG
jgi:DNA topoisomerase VI subunit B